MSNDHSSGYWRFLYVNIERFNRVRNWRSRGMGSEKGRAWWIKARGEIEGGMRPGWRGKVVTRRLTDLRRNHSSPSIHRRSNGKNKKNDKNTHNLEGKGIPFQLKWFADINFEIGLPFDDVHWHWSSFERGEEIEMGKKNIEGNSIMFPYAVSD